MTPKITINVNKELEELNKKVDALQNSLKETQDKQKKAEAQLKTPPVKPVKKPGQVKGLKLKAGKKKVTVTYKKVKGKNYTGKWSAVKKVKVK